MSRRPVALVLALAPLALAACHAGLEAPPPAPSEFARQRPAPPSHHESWGGGGWGGGGGSGGPAAAPAPSAAPRVPAAKGWPASAPAARAEAAPSSDEGWRVESEQAEEAPPAEKRKVESGARRDRPGLGTEWGETRWSPVREVPFERASERPFSVATLYYNDRAGVDAMASYDLRRGARTTAPVVVRPGITVSIVDDRGVPLDAVALDGRVYVVGEAGRRYAVVVSNSTDHRVEVVLSIDGLDAVDGKAASVGKRGYLLDPYDTLTVDGFRRSAEQVAAFRFGSVRGSYAARTGSDRNVGVVGVALFAERGSEWDDDEIERRRSAEPFSDSRYAQPPSSWE